MPRIFLAVVAWAACGSAFVVPQSHRGALLEAVAPRQGFEDDLVSSGVSSSGVSSSGVSSSGVSTAATVRRREALFTLGTTVVAVAPAARASVAEPTASAIGKAVDPGVARKILQIERLNVDSNVNGDPKKHLPQVAVADAKVTCTVPHVMDPAKPHFIEYLWLKDEATETIIAAKQFKATDPAPPSLVAPSVKRGTTVVPVAYCNLHGLWIGDAELV
eukprot:CAMPEP_0118889380 /NCGR_PEP_ID=MMETSP1166-20130328/333_1 /TAXON_ID=1104430 /ORGANISM="Chrysoreinhardia sp, Strain CCMP3193" /LENGTH=217 /DNA_ID=CAMNT_0006827967 /DNA_START=22 /DNA_END=675 /DNA_ORIENTATION=-